MTAVFSVYGITFHLGHERNKRLLKIRMLNIEDKYTDTANHKKKRMRNELVKFCYTILHIRIQSSKCYTEIVVLLFGALHNVSH